MATEITVSQWQDRIRNGQRFQSKFGKSSCWETYKRYYRHEFGSGIIPVNLVFSILRSMVPQVYFRNPSVTCTARKPGLQNELNARIVEHLDNWLLQELSSKYEFKKMVTDTFLCGISNGFIGYDSEYGFSPEKFEESGGFSLTQFDKKGYRIEQNASINPGMPWFLRARPEDVIYPWGTESAINSEWVAMRVFRPVDHVKMDKKYTNTSDLTGSFTQQRTGPEGSVQPDPYQDSGLLKDREWVEIWQIHDACTGKVFAITMNHDKFLRNEVDELQIEGLPVVNMVFNPDPDYIYGIPDARIIEPQLLELNEIRTQAMKHRRIDIAKFLYKKKAIDARELLKMTNESVGAGVEVDTDGPLSDAIMTLQPGASGILQDLIAAGETVMGDVRETVGFSRVAQGAYQGKTHITAEETSRVFQSLQIRLDERRDIAADCLSQVIRKWNQIIFKFWDAEKVAQVDGPEGAHYWLKFTGPQIKGEYDIKVEAQEGPPTDSQSRKQSANEMAAAWSKMNQGQVAAGVPVPAEIQRYVFSNYADINIDKVLTQSQAAGQLTQQAQAGGAPGSAISPGQLAAIVARRGGQQ